MTQPGHHWRATSFTNDFFTPTAIKAGWERLVGRERENPYQWTHTWHSLRHRAGTDLIEVHGLSPAELTAVGGWDSIAVVFARYYGQSAHLYGQSADLLEQVFRKTQERIPVVVKK